MNNLEKLIEQYETETNENAKLGYGRAFVEWLASRPTCGKEQRKFLDAIEQRGKFDKTNCAIEFGEDDDSIMVWSDFYLLDVPQNEKDYINLSKVIKGE